MKTKSLISICTIMLLFLFSFLSVFSPSLDTVDMKRELIEFELESNESFYVINKSDIHVEKIIINLELGESFKIEYNIITDVVINSTVKMINTTRFESDFHGLRDFLIQASDHLIKGIIEIRYGVGDIYVKIKV